MEKIILLSWKKFTPVISHKCFGYLVNQIEFFTIKCVCKDVLRSQDNKVVSPKRNIEIVKAKEAQPPAADDINLKRELGLFSAVNLILNVMIGNEPIRFIIFQLTFNNTI